MEGELVTEGLEVYTDDWSSEIHLLEENLDGSKPVIIEGKMQHGDVINGNGRVYLDKFLRSNIERLQPVIKARKLYGELDHPGKPTILYKNASHLIVESDYKEGTNEVWGKFQVLRDHPNGMIVLSILKEEGGLATSSRALGKAKPAIYDRKRVGVIGSDMKVLTWDLVTENSTPGCDDWSLVQESLINYVAESMKKDTPKEQDIKIRSAVNSWLYGSL
jgi:hypothetical protein